MRESRRTSKEVSQRAIDEMWRFQMFLLLVGIIVLLGSLCFIRPIIYFLW